VLHSLENTIEKYGRPKKILVANNKIFAVRFEK